MILRPQETMKIKAGKTYRVRNADGRTTRIIPEQDNALTASGDRPIEVEKIDD